MKPWNRDYDCTNEHVSELWAKVEAYELLFATGRSHDTPFVAIVPREFFENNRHMCSEVQISHLLPNGWGELSGGVFELSDHMSCGDATKALLDKGFQPSKKFQDFVDASGDDDERKYGIGREDRGGGENQHGGHEQHGRHEAHLRPEESQGG